MSERIFIKKEYEKDIQAYIDYKNIVGTDDGGKLMSEKEFEAYKLKVADARKNHLYVYWVNSKGNDCKAIGPESMCFCGHRFKMHNFDNVKTKKVDCKDNKCKCKLFEYIPVHGSNDIKCLCKHSYTLHDNLKRNCTKPGCTCSSFGSKMTCNCTNPFDDHMTLIETKEERQSRGKSVDPAWLSNMTAGMGGLNSFTSMVGDVYEMEYQKLMHDPKDMKMIAEDFQNKINFGGDLRTKKSGMTMFELFSTPSKWEVGSLGKETLIGDNYEKYLGVNKKVIGGNKQIFQDSNQSDLIQYDNPYEMNSKNINLSKKK